MKHKTENRLRTYNCGDRFIKLKSEKEKQKEEKHLCNW